MAKRSVKRERQRAREVQRPEPAAAAGPAARGRSFWLGVLVAAALLVPAGVVAVLVASGSSGEDDGQAAFAESIESEAEALRRQTQVRDREQVEELTNRMRETVAELAPVLDGFAETFPPGEDSETGPLADPSDVEQWRRTVRAADEYFAETVSGETGTNIARGGFAAAIDALRGATETYRLALSQRDGRRALLERAREQRNLAVRTWSVAATQLDAINIATGFGHQHVYLGGTAEAGGFGADPAPEGSGADDDHADE